MISCGTCRHSYMENKANGIFNGGCKLNSAECLTQSENVGATLAGDLFGMVYDYRLYEPIQGEEIENDALNKLETETPSETAQRLKNIIGYDNEQMEKIKDYEICEGDSCPECGDLDECFDFTFGKPKPLSAEYDEETKSFLMPEPKVEKDALEHPSHYAEAKIPSGIECWDHYELAMSEEEFAGAMKNNIYKYIFRAGRKNPAKKIEDLTKAINYLKRWITYLEGNRIVWMRGQKNDS